MSTEKKSRRSPSAVELAAARRTVQPSQRLVGVLQGKDSAIAAARKEIERIPASADQVVAVTPTRQSLNGASSGAKRK